MIKINILFPVYNEHLRLEKGIIQTIEYLNTIIPDEYKCTIIDNASTDDTSEIALRLKSAYKEVEYIRLEEKGVGIAFREGVLVNSAPIVGYMDVDLSTDIKHLRDVLEIFSNEHIKIVNGSRWNKQSKTLGRKWYRKVTSNGLVWLLKISLGMKASDGICGFKFFRDNTVKELIKEAGNNENGWFYIIELLLRAERKKVNIFELPVRWKDDYNTTVNVKKQIINYIKEIIKLKIKFLKE